MSRGVRAVEIIDHLVNAEGLLKGDGGSAGALRKGAYQPFQLFIAGFFKLLPGGCADSVGEELNCIQRQLKSPVKICRVRVLRGIVNHLFPESFRSQKGKVEKVWNAVAAPGSTPARGGDYYVPLVFGEVPFNGVQIHLCHFPGDIAVVLRRFRVGQSLLLQPPKVGTLPCLPGVAAGHSPKIERGKAGVLIEVYFSVAHGLQNARARANVNAFAFAGEIAHRKGLVLYFKAVHISHRLRACLST